MNEWTDDDALDAPGEQLNIPSPHWEDYAAGPPQENDEIIRQREPWERPEGGHAIGFLTKLLGLMPLMEWAKGYDMKPTWGQDLMFDVLGNNLPGPEGAAKLLLPAAAGAVKWGKKVIPNMFVYRGMGNPEAEVPWWNSVIKYAKHIINPEEQSASLVTPKFLGTAYPEGLLLHGDTAEMPAIGLGDIYSSFTRPRGEGTLGHKMMDLPAIEAEHGAGLRSKWRPSDTLYQKQAESMIDLLGDPAREAFSKTGFFDKWGKGRRYAFWDALDKLGLRTGQGFSAFEQAPWSGMLDPSTLSREQLATLDKLVPKGDSGWYERLQRFLADPENYRVLYLTHPELQAVAKAKGFKDYPLGEFSLLNPGLKARDYEYASQRVRRRLEDRYPEPYRSNPDKYENAFHDELLVDPTTMLPKEFLKLQGQRFARTRASEGPTGFFNEIIHKVDRDIAERLAGVRVDPLYPSSELIDFAEKHKLPVYAWPYRARHPEEFPPHTTLRVKRRPFSDLMWSKDPLGGSWADVRDIPNSPLPLDLMGGNFLTSTELPLGFNYEYTGRPFHAY